MSRRTHHYPKIVGLGHVVTGILMLMATGCTQYHDLSAFRLEPHVPASDVPYHVAPPDTLTIRSSVVSEIDNANVTVGPEGTIMLPLLGTVQASGQTTEQIADNLRERAREYYQDADVTVNVSRYRSKFVYVFGEVRLAGRFPYTGANTVLELLAEAQPTRAADDNRIQILRPQGDGQTAKRMTVHLAEWVQKGRTDRNALLEPGDIVYVPPNGFAEVGYAIQNLLRPISPAAATVRGTASVDSGATSLSRQ